MTGEEAPEGLGSGREEGRKGGGWADVDEVRPEMDAMEARSRQEGWVPAPVQLGQSRVLG